MKSIIKEASSIAKAVEQCWHAAGKPEQFSVKVLEQPERNFLGITTRSAKVALIVGDTRDKRDRRKPQKSYKITESKQQRPNNRKKPAHTNDQKTPREAVKKDSHKKTQTNKPQQQKPAQKTEQKREPRQIQPQWNDHMLAYAQAWLDKTLKTAHKKSIRFSIEPQGQYLRITLNEQILPDPAQEKHLLASLSTLLIESLKRHFKKPLRGHKVVLTHKDGK